MRKPASPKKPLPDFTANLLANAGGVGEAPPVTKAQAKAATAALEYPHKHTNRLTDDNKEWLDQAAYWMPGKGQYQRLLNQALNFYRTHKDGYQGTVKPIPDEQ